MMQRYLGWLVSGLLLSGGAIPAHETPLDGAKPVQLDVPAQPMIDALNQFATQAGVRIVFYTEVTQGVTSPPVVGSFTPDEGLRELLKGSGLEFTFKDARTVEIRGRTDRQSVTADAPSAMRVAQAEATNANVAAQDSSAPASMSDGEQGEESKLEEILVTGTHIRGRAPQSSPLTVLTRQDIDRTGYTNVTDLMASVPQNFAGLSSGTTYTRQAADAANAAYGTAVDLRGLGGDTTLVLVNGHRLAPSGNYGALTDVSVIPLSAIERVEILTDGASAIYGSDAIGGVVNYILRDDFVGSETSLLYGVATGGVHDELRAGQSFGTRWSQGHVLLSYEFLGQDALRAADRSFASGVAPADLTPKARQHSAFLAASQSLSDIWEIKGEASYADRANDFRTYVFGTLQPVEADTKQWSIALDNGIVLTPSWDLSLMASYNVNQTVNENQFVGFEGGGQSDARFATFGAQVEGALGAIWGGDVRAALGTQYRSERFERTFDGAFVTVGPNIDTDRSIRAAFAELAIPIVGESNKRRGLERLEVNIAGRYERYSDFGSSFDPKLGLSWLISPSTHLRGTVSTAFKAPNFQQLQGGGIVILENSADPLAPGGSSPTLVLFGQNPGLDAQESTQWTAGFDITPQSLPGLAIRTTYFDIDFEGRLAIPGLSELDAAAPPEDQDFVNRDPSLDEVTAFVDAVGTANFFDITPLPGFGPPRTLADVTVIADGRVQNIASTDVRGVDLAVSFERQASQLQYELGLSGTYLFDFENRARADATPVTELNRLGRPVRLKLRANGTVSHGPLSATLALNHVGDYTNETALPTPVPVASWTTADLQLHYQSDWDIALSCLNLLDKDPPFAQNFALFAPFLGYDPANANPFGRAVSLQVKRKW